jgi:diamine N-acetyltransferase
MTGGRAKVELREITRDNWRECTRLKVAESQQNFVAPNAHSLAMAAYEPGLYPRAIYDNEGTMVGFIMYGWWEEKGCWWIARVMVDERFQGRGYGRAAMEQALDIMERERPGKEVGISFVPENSGALALYTSLGFLETDEVGAEIILRKPCKECATQAPR